MRDLHTMERCIKMDKRLACAKKEHIRKTNKTHTHTPMRKIRFVHLCGCSFVAGQHVECWDSAKIWTIFCAHPEVQSQELNPRKKNKQKWNWTVTIANCRPNIALLSDVRYKRVCTYHSNRRLYTVIRFAGIVVVGRLFFFLLFHSILLQSSHSARCSDETKRARAKMKKEEKWEKQATSWSPNTKHTHTRSFGAYTHTHTHAHTGANITIECEWAFLSYCLANGVSISRALHLPLYGLCVNARVVFIYLCQWRRWRDSDTTVAACTCVRVIQWCRCVFVCIWWIT